MRFIHDGGASRLGFTVFMGRWQLRLSWSQVALWRDRSNGSYQQYVNRKNPFFDASRSIVR